MIFRNLFTVILITFSVCLSAQKAPYKFGDITKVHFEKSDPSNFPDEKAVIIADWGHVSLISGGNSIDAVFKHHIRVRILTEDGLDKANLNFIYGGNNISLGSFKGVTYNLENGKVVETKVGNKDKVKEKLDDGLWQTKIAFPNVKPGSIIEYRYTKTYDNGFYSLRPWYFQHEIPCMRSEYVVWTPKILTYKSLMHGYISLDYATPFGKEISSDRMEYRYLAKDVEPFKKEPFMTCEDDYISYIEFELSMISIPGRPAQTFSGTKADLQEDILKRDNFGGFLNGNNFIESDVAAITRGTKTPEEKMNIIHAYVKDNFEWNGKRAVLASTKPRKLLDERKGNSADINLLMTVMLRKAGIDANPVILSTRNNGRQMPSFLMLNKFNYVVSKVEIGDEHYLLDATNPHLALGLLPFRCLNGEGIVIYENRPAQIVSLDPRVPSNKSIVANLSLDVDGGLTGSLTSTLNGYYALERRIELAEKKEKKETNSATDDDEDDHDHDFEMKILDYEAENIDEFNKALKEKAEIKVLGAVDVTPDIIYINPVVFSRYVENPFKLDKRKYPVNFGYPRQFLYSMTIKLPEGYEIEDLPETKAVALPNRAGIFQYDIKPLGENLVVTNRVSINKPEFAYSEYPYLKEFYDIIVGKHGEQVVLKKIN